MIFDEYVRPKPSCSLILTGLFCICPASMTYLLIFETEGIVDLRTTIIVNILLWLIPILIFIVPYSVKSFQYKRRKKMLEARGLLKIAEEDF